MKQVSTINQEQKQCMAQLVQLRHHCAGHKPDMGSWQTDFGQTSAAHFNNHLSNTIQIWWPIHYALIQIIMKWSLQNFAQVMTAVLSWHVQTFVMIQWYCLIYKTILIVHRIWIASKKCQLKKSEACLLRTGLILGLCPANERHRHKVMASLIGWAQT